MKNLRKTHLLPLILLPNLTFAATDTPIEQSIAISSWPVWLGVFAFAVIFVLFTSRRVKTKTPPGKFDNSIYEHATFKIASLVLIIMIFGMMLV